MAACCACRVRTPAYELLRYAPVFCMCFSQGSTCFRCKHTLHALSGTAAAVCRLLSCRCTHTFEQPLAQGPDGHVLCLSCQDPSLRTIKVWHCATCLCVARMLWLLVLLHLSLTCRCTAPAMHNAMYSNASPGCALLEYLCSCQSCSSAPSVAGA
jgi:hypothetical protein